MWPHLRSSSARAFRHVLLLLALVGPAALTGRSTAVVARSAAAPLPTYAQPLSPQQALERLFTADQIDPDWFAPAFLVQVPAARVRAIIAGLQESLGPYQAVQPADRGFRVLFAGGTVPAQISLDGDGRIAGLLFGNPEATDPAEGRARAVDALRRLPGQVGLLILRGDAEVAALSPDTALPVGSAFKLVILLALRRQIESGAHRWDEVVALRPEWKSLPSGMLQNWPDGSPVTIATLASLMISISDNTAADALLDLVGREAAEALTPRNRPFFSTRELFVLKTPANRDLLDRYRTGDVEARRAVLAEADRRPLPATSDYPTAPTALDVEWLFSPRELCGLIAQVADLPPMGINPGVASPQDWARVAYKGGSEPGVLNLTHFVEDKDGTSRCVAVTWTNDAPVDEQRLALLIRQVLATLK